MFTETAFRPDDWGPLAARYQDPRPRRLLALDGGGIRGLITLRVLDRIEHLLRERLGLDETFRLSDYFDYIGGTSTGAIIAAGLARGMTVKKIQEFYSAFAQQVFKKRWLPGQWFSKYHSQGVERQLKEVFTAGADLRPKNLKCLFLAVTRNATTDSVWPISSNPAATFNDPRDRDCNLRIPIWEIVRASSAAPTFFPPKPVILDPRDPKSGFVFVDGGTTAYNNPAFLLFRMATSEPYRLCWETGEKKLLMISIGTGKAKVQSQPLHKPNLGFAKNVKSVLNSLMHQALIDQDTVCRTIGRCTYGHLLDYEIGDLIPRNKKKKLIPLSQDLGRAFLYARYNTSLTERGLDVLGLEGIQPSKVSALDSVKAMDDLIKVGDALASKVDIDHFGGFGPPLTPTDAEP